MPTLKILDTRALCDTDYQHYILQRVSRSFALTIPQLPDQLIPLVGNAYLLCRIADTIEDDVKLHTEQKRFFLRQFLAVLKGEFAAHELGQGLRGQMSERTSSAEKDLIENIDRVIRITHGFSAKQQRILRRCVKVMSEGMVFFQSRASAAGLASIREMNSYCYHVAGVVGEMLTELFCDYSEAINSNRVPLQELAVSFGQGLQMTNILKDIWEDQERNVSWLPRDIFLRNGIDLESLAKSHQSEEFAEVLEDLIAITHAHLCRALQYTLLLPKQEQGLRKFCLWAIGMAVMTLRKISRHPSFSAGHEVKISRRTLKITIALSNLAVSHNGLIRAQFKLATMGLPRPQFTKLSVADMRVEGGL